MTTSEPLTTTTDPLAVLTCDVCPHPWHEHDPLGVRYCNATAASALPRGCICS
ncbi:RGCVC family protein [Lentzea sp. BCCO 10_0061]|uniref:RGCVC family protein n=1 Tax=Lentzea sokolovensis TaxID=3095429 RepID=A0ABU4URG6_9PSEU|nr:RGCVC family protein [Lentzea sp. BCCO 10_0061]MDX8141870.1 RGCVC family protein [Lentzea sp. BCCO 10_0061]